uniref:Uncharacterized protein n=1 Tax=Brassica oleracea TaxID=3712 RepID=A0A3P6B3W8_BRAOL|nr:unnamed protein product [Brassica oleracea]
MTARKQRCLCDMKNFLDFASFAGVFVIKRNCVHLMRRMQRRVQSAGGR